MPAVQVRRERSVSGPAWPVKTRDIRNHHMDSTVWDTFRFRPDDIVVATYAKAGTTWMQQIVSQLIHGGAEDVVVHASSFWLDNRSPPKDVKFAALEAQAGRRQVKTHLPVDALVFSPMARYVYVARDGRDVVWSLHHHHMSANAEFYEVLNDTPGRFGPPIEPPPASRVDYFADWLEQDGYPYWSFWENIATWWAVRDLPNVLLVHFDELKDDLPAMVRRVADFLDFAPSPAELDKVVAHCRFDYMKAHADQIAPRGGAFWEGGGKTFINKGTNGRWRDELPDELSRAYEQRAMAELGADCAAWLRGKGGRLTQE